MTVSFPPHVQGPTSRRAGLLGGAAGLLAGGAAGALLLTHGGWWLDGLGTDRAQPVATGLEHLAATAAAVLLGWIAALLLLGAASVTPGRFLGPVRRLGRNLAPRWVPRIGTLLLALALAGPAAAAAETSWPAPATVTATTPAPVPDWSVGASSPALAGVGDPAAPPAPQPGWQPPEPRRRADVRLLVGGGPRIGAPDPSVAETVVVRSGDTLWSIAARHLGPDAAPEDIAAEWPRWHAANEDVIGPDPDLIRPGQELVPPGHVPTGVAS